MRHLKKFSTEADRIAYENSDGYIEPYVSLVGQNSSVHYNRVPPNYLRFTALENNSTLQLKKWDSDSEQELTPTAAIEYSWDGFNFTEYDYSELDFSKGETVYLRGNNPNGFSIFDEDSGTWIWHCFATPTGSFECHGNIMSLIYGADFETSPNALVIPDNCQLYALFYNGSDDEGCNIITAPELPATKLQPNCYSHMFQSCESLITAPKLPATTLENDCYSGMFYYCPSLTTAPELPATTLASQCYSYMFYGCTNLNYIKAMFTTIPSTSYTSTWVSGVAANGTFIKNSVATWDVTGVHGIPSNWTVETATE